MSKKLWEYAMLGMVLVFFAIVVDNAFFQKIPPSVGVAIVAVMMVGFFTTKITRDVRVGWRQYRLKRKGLCACCGQPLPVPVAKSEAV